MIETEERGIGRLGRPRYLILGMDPGIASCGFALIDINNHENGSALVRCSAVS